MTIIITEQVVNELTREEAIKHIELIDSEDDSICYSCTPQVLSMFLDKLAELCPERLD